MILPCQSAALILATDERRWNTDKKNKNKKHLVVPEKQYNILIIKELYYLFWVLVLQELAKITQKSGNLWYRNSNMKNPNCFSHV